MSTVPRTEAFFIQDNQSKVEPSDSHSALFYLFHEVSKLAAPIQNSFLDTNLPFKQPKEATGENCFTEKEEPAACSSLEDPLVGKDKDAFLLQCCHRSHRHSLCCMIPYNQMKNAMEEGHSSGASALCDPRGEWNSPLKVLSLINLQCERLLHDKDVEEPSVGLGLSSSGVDHLNATPTPGVTEGGVTEDGVEGTPGPLLQLCERQNSPASARTAEDLNAASSEEFAVDAGEGCSSQMHPAEKPAPLTVALHEPISAQGSREKSSVDKQLELFQECKKGCVVTEQDLSNAPHAENVLQQMHTPSSCSKTQITFSSSSMEFIDVPKPTATLDHNANVTLSTKEPCNIQLPLTSADLVSSLILNTARSHPSLSGQHEHFSASKFESSPPTLEENHTAGDRSRSSSSDLPSAISPELRRVGNDEKEQLPTNKCRTKTRRKQPHPCRSADVQDPDFQGVTFRIDTELDDNREQCRLLITAKYRSAMHVHHSKVFWKSVRKPKRTRTAQKWSKTSSSDEENDHSTTINRGKACASCCTRKTPMWRDAEDGTPLCNACGIRYKKYRVRCVKCWHIPRKEGNSNSFCIRCGNFVKLSSAQRKHPS